MRAAEEMTFVDNSGLMEMLHAPDAEFSASRLRDEIKALRNEISLYGVSTIVVAYLIGRKLVAIEGSDMSRESKDRLIHETCRIGKRQRQRYKKVFREGGPPHTFQKNIAKLKMLSELEDAPVVSITGFLAFAKNQFKSLGSSPTKKRLEKSLSTATGGGQSVESAIEASNRSEVASPQVDEEPQPVQPSDRGGDVVEAVSVRPTAKPDGSVASDSTDSLEPQPASKPLIDVESLAFHERLNLAVDLLNSLPDDVGPAVRSQVKFFVEAVPEPSETGATSDCRELITAKQGTLINRLAVDKKDQREFLALASEDSDSRVAVMRGVYARVGPRMMTPKEKNHLAELAFELCGTKAKEVAVVPPTREELEQYAIELAESDPRYARAPECVDGFLDHFTPARWIMANGRPVFDPLWRFRKWVRDQNLRDPDKPKSLEEIEAFAVECRKNGKRPDAIQYAERFWLRGQKSGWMVKIGVPCFDWRSWFLEECTRWGGAPVLDPDATASLSTSKKRAREQAEAEAKKDRPTRTRENFLRFAIEEKKLDPETAEKHIDCYIADREASGWMEDRGSFEAAIRDWRSDLPVFLDRKKEEQREAEHKERMRERSLRAQEKRLAAGTRSA
ncbi:MAG: hypothetical protein AAF802_01740 [Planctomycetota bacterium]